MSHFIYMFCLGFHGGFWGTSLLHRLAQLTWYGLMVPSQNRSFLEKSIQTLILYRRCPLWTVFSASFTKIAHLDKFLVLQVLLGPVNKISITVLDSHGVFQGRFLPHVITPAYCLQLTIVSAGYPTGAARHSYGCTREPACQHSCHLTTEGTNWPTLASVSCSQLPACIRALDLFKTMQAHQKPHSILSYSRHHKSCFISAVFTQTGKSIAT